jgi:outer membrane lipoprotein-sorting protein
MGRDDAGLTPRMLRARSSALILLLALGPAGCAKPKQAAPAAPLAPVRTASLDEVRTAYDSYCKALETLSVSGDLDVRDARTGKSQHLGVRMLATRGGRLYLKGSVAVITALEVVSNGDRFWFQVPSKKTVWTGRANDAPQSERADAPYYALRPRDVTDAFFPEPLDPSEGEILVLEADRQAFSLTLAGRAASAAVARRRVWLNRETLEPMRTRSFDARGDLVSEVSLSGWRDGLPRQVVISRPSEGYTAAFELEKFDRNVKLPERAFEPRTPAGYKVVELS